VVVRARSRLPDGSGEAVALLDEEDIIQRMMGQSLGHGRSALLCAGILLVSHKCAKAYFIFLSNIIPSHGSVDVAGAVKMDRLGSTLGRTWGKRYGILLRTSDGRVF
jgi:hypothetical protein